MAWIVSGQRYDYSQYPLGSYSTEREARAAARRHLGCQRLRHIPREYGDEEPGEAYAASLEAEPMNGDGVVVIEEDANGGDWSRPGRRRAAERERTMKTYRWQGHRVTVGRQLVSDGQGGYVYESYLRDVDTGYLVARNLRVADLVPEDIARDTAALCDMTGS